MNKLNTILSVVVIAFLMGFSGDKKQVDWYGWNKGYQKGIKKEKVILVDVYTDWCGWCKKMDKTTYSNPDIVNMIREDFIPIKFNPEDKKTYVIDGNKVNGRKLLQIISSGKHSGYPSTYFLFPSQREIKKVGGYRGPKAFKKTLKNIKAYKQKIESKQQTAWMCASPSAKKASWRASPFIFTNYQPTALSLFASILTFVVAVNGSTLPTKGNLS